MSSIVYVIPLPGAYPPQVLMEQRPIDDTFAPGEWVFPGGKIDPEDATPEAALEREILEEVGLKKLKYAPLAGRFLRIYHRQVDKDHRLYPYLITDFKGEIPTAVLDTGHPLLWRLLSDSVHSDVNPTLTIAGLAWAAIQQSMPVRG